MSALSAGITQGIGGGELLKGAGNFVNDVARGALTNALTQGIGVVTGLQKSFSWTGVAVAGISAGVTGAAARGLAKAGIGVRPDEISSATPRTASFYANTALSGAAGAIAEAGARSLISGSDFGDNLLATLPGVVGNTLGDMLGTIGQQVFTPDPLRGVYITASGPGDPPTSGEAGPTPPTSNSQEDQPISVPGITRAQLDDYARTNLVDLRNQRDSKHGAALVALNDRIAGLERIDEALKHAVVGTTIWLHRPNQPPQPYVIRGYSSGDNVIAYNRPVDVAIDGMAMAFQIARITHDSYERGGMIERLPDGVHFTYRALALGARLKSDITINGEHVGKGTPYIPGVPPRHPAANMVGYFHIHPGAPNLGADNAGFSPGDRAGYAQSGLPRGYEVFVAGNDGSLWQLRPSAPNSHGVTTPVETRLERRGFFRVTPTMSLPTGMHGEPI
jgi:hypothetical protein